MGAKSAKVVNTCMTTPTTFRQAFRKQAVNISGAVIIIPSMFVGVFYFLGWMDNTYASDEQVKVIQSQIETQTKKFDTWVFDQKRDKLEFQVESIADAIFDLERKMDDRGDNVSDDDRRQLGRLERRLERYEGRLDKLELEAAARAAAAASFTAPTE